jgi:hypothetical protein
MSKGLARNSKRTRVTVSYKNVIKLASDCSTVVVYSTTSPVAEGSNLGTVRHQVEKLCNQLYNELFLLF